MFLRELSLTHGGQGCPPRLPPRWRRYELWLFLEFMLASNDKFIA